MKLKAVVALVLVAVVCASSGAEVAAGTVSRVARSGSVASVTSARTTSARTTSATSARSTVATSTTSGRSTAPAPSIPRYEEDDDEPSVSTLRLFDVDGYDHGDGNECFVDDEGADYFPGDDDFEDPGDAAVRGQWVKCLPPVFSVIAQARTNGKNLYPQLQQLYAALREIHHELKTHVYVDIGIDADGEEDSEMLNILTEAVLGLGDFANNGVQGRFLSKLINDTRRYLSFLITNKYAELEAPYELGTIFSEEEDRDVDNYLKKTLVFSKEGMTTMNNFPVPNIKLVEIRTEIEDADATNLDELEGFNVCGDQSDDFETGGACMWVIDQTMYDALPDDQRNGFHNTQINDRVNQFFNRGGLRRSYFTGEIDDDKVFIFNNKKKIRINNEDGFYVHTHMAYDNDAFLRVYTYQHVAERNYPGQIQKVCFCDWRLLTQVAEQTDCTLTYEANNGCQFDDGENDDEDAVIADELGWLLDPQTGDRYVNENGEYLCCRNCQNSEGENPECKDNYEDTRNNEDDEDDDEDDEDDDEEVASARRVQRTSIPTARSGRGRP